jgi:hypothetical protein
LIYPWCFGDNFFLIKACQISSSFRIIKIWSLRKFDNENEKVNETIIEIPNKKTKYSFSEFDKQEIGFSS